MIAPHEHRAALSEDQSDQRPERKTIPHERRVRVEMAYCVASGRVVSLGRGAHDSSGRLAPITDLPKWQPRLRVIAYCLGCCTCQALQ